MSDIAIKVENLSKLYRLGSIGTGSIASDLTRWWASVRGKEDPFSLVAVANDRSQKATSDYVWSLKDIDFDIKKGDAVGIVGRNGAGKSTLLKILSRVTTPTTGSVKINGRVASLLEVGTGFSPDLTGRENVFMNGSILGMSRREIASKLDEIIDFSGVEGYIDTPVKRYSSGMYVRLAFAVAAHLQPEILIVDEVLAVGDAEFQKKCMGKMQDVNENEGRTVLFVSHNMGAISNLTNRCIYLKNGGLVQVGSTSDVIEYYQKSNDSKLGNKLSHTKEILDTNKPIEFLSFEIDPSSGTVLDVKIRYKVRRTVGSVVSIKVSNLQGTTMVTLRDTDTDNERFTKTQGEFETFFSLPIDKYAPNIYLVTFSLSDMKSERFDFYSDFLSFEIGVKPELQSFASREGVMMDIIDWQTLKTV